MCPQRAGSLVALLTDFGAQDTYVGVMKAVIAGLAPEATLIDLSHGVRQGDLKEAAFKLWQSVPYFPPETIFVVVVDPGVGTERRAVAVRWDKYHLVAPDNGVLSYLMAKSHCSQAVELNDPQFQLVPTSNTFHGRDIFAPAGGHLAAGTALEDLGSPISELQELKLPTLTLTEDGLAGEVVHVDRFGNLITSLGRLRRAAGGLHLSPWLPMLGARDLEGDMAVTLPDGARLPVGRTFGDVPEGQPVAYLGSEALLEVAINGGNAAEHFELAVGDPVKLEIRG